MIFHLCERKLWEQGKKSGAYAPASLKSEGFIHLSSYGQILSIANWWYKKSEDPVLLAIENNKPNKFLKWEGEDGLDFPHLYRAIEANEVVAVLSLKRDGDLFVDTTELQKFGQALSFETERLILREFHLNDFDLIQEYASDPNLVKHMIWGPNDRVETRKFLSRVFQWQTQSPRDEFHFAVIEKESGCLVGACNLTVESLQYGVGSIGYILNSKYHGRGYATEFSKMLLHIGFDDLNLNRIEATCDQDNHASFKVMRNLGMSQEGLLREDKIIKGRKRNTIICSILKSEANKTLK